MKKKIMLILLAACLAITCFAGCKKEEDPKATNKPTAKATAAATPTTKPTATAAAATPTAEATTAPTQAPVVDGVVFRFDNEDDYDSSEGAYAGSFAGYNNITDPFEVTKENGMTFEILGNDPYVMYTGFDPFELSEYPFMKVCIKNNTPSEKYEAFIIPSTAAGAAAGDDFNDVISANDTEFKSYVFDLTTLKSDAYINRTVGSIRLDNVSLDGKTLTDDMTFSYKYIAFFKTAEAANAYN